MHLRTKYRWEGWGWGEGQNSGVEKGYGGGGEMPKLDHRFKKGEEHIQSSKARPETAFARMLGSHLNPALHHWVV